jgi:hypothetical protein
MAKKETVWMPHYSPSKDEHKWHNFCATNGIIVSPIAAQQGPNPTEWKIGISFMPNYKKINLTPSIYIADIIWEETFKIMKYYYDKYR